MAAETTTSRVRKLKLPIEPGYSPYVVGPDGRLAQVIVFDSESGKHGQYVLEDARTGATFYRTAVELKKWRELVREDDG